MTGGHDFIAKCGNGSEEIDGRWQNNSLCLTNMSPGVLWKVSNDKTLSGETFCSLEKHLLSIFKFCASSNLKSHCQPWYIACHKHKSCEFHVTQNYW